jgi:hypothetical protein
MTSINPQLQLVAAKQYGNDVSGITPLGSGLINQTWLVRYADRAPLVLQRLNTSAFTEPQKIIRNYRRIQEGQNSRQLQICSPLEKTLSGQYFFEDGDHNFWRATAFMPSTTTLPVTRDPVIVRSAVQAFALFTASLSGIDPTSFDSIIPEFHNLALRYGQFEAGIRKADIKRLLKATHVISELRARTALVDLYHRISSDNAAYPVRIMHHDCKINNVLFDAETGKAVCVVDLDTVMPGKIFSDIGDMIRTMTCTEEENSSAWENIDVDPLLFKTIIEAYIEGFGAGLTEAEKAILPQAGLILTFMQSLRFVTDFLENDRYYHTHYPEQNLNRALNQLILLEKMEILTGAA